MQGYNNLWEWSISTEMHGNDTIAIWKFTTKEFLENANKIEGHDSLMETVIPQ